MTEYELLSEAMQYLDDELLQEADMARNRSNPKKRRTLIPWISAAAACAACFMLLLAGGAFDLGKSTQNMSEAGIQTADYAESAAERADGTLESAEDEPETESAGEETVESAAAEASEEAAANDAYNAEGQSSVTRDIELEKLNIDMSTAEGLTTDSRIASYDISEITASDSWNELSDIETLPVYRKIQSDSEDPANIGDYPIVSVKEARELLLEGFYMGESSGSISDPSLIKKAELVYAISDTSEYIMPYYMFYAENPDSPEDKEEGGQSDYEIYYVPAIEREYIECR